MTHDVAVDTNYFKRIRIEAPIDRVFGLLTTLDGIRTWWEGTVSGDPTDLGELRFGVHDSDDYTQIQVAGISFPSEVAWSVLEDSGYGGEWLNTSIVFNLQEELDASTWLALHHRGLTPLLDCFADCVTGWEHRLVDIKHAAESESG